jgi:sulfite exporter TauE/SafE
MDPAAAAFAGLALGLSSGAHCFWSCASVMGPFIVATDASPLERRWASVGPALRLLGWYNLGRLLAYLAAGLAVSLWASAGGLPPAVQAGALWVTAALLAVTVVRPARRSTNQGRGCWLGQRRGAGALAMGVLQGLSPCPPFLVAVGLVLAAPGVAGGVVLFLSLFVGTALYTLPLAFLEPLQRRRWLYQLCRVVGGLVAAYLVVRGVLLVG